MEKPKPKINPNIGMETPPGFVKVFQEVTKDGKVNEVFLPVKKIKRRR